jgi:hypothetical protein
MAHFLAMKHGCEHRQDGFDQHPRVPSAMRTDLQVGGVAGLGMETSIGQDHQLAIKLGNQGVKMRIVDVGSRAVPGTNQAPLVQDAAELPAANPPMIALALLPYLGRAAAFPHGMDQLDPIAVGATQHRRRCQKAGGPCRVGFEASGQAGTLGHLRKQCQGVARQPAIEGAGPAAFDRIQQGQRHDFTGIQFRVRVFRDLQHLLVHRIEQCDNKIWGRPMTGSSWLKFASPQLEPVCDYLSTPIVDVTYQTNTIG